MKYTGTSTRASCHVYYKTRGFLILYVFYITTTPYLPYNNKNINFYYMAITLTTGYNITYAILLSHIVMSRPHNDQLDEVRAWLDERHPSGYLVFNLSGDSYDPNKLGNQVRVPRWNTRLLCLPHTVMYARTCTCTCTRGGQH